MTWAMRLYWMVIVVMALAVIVGWVLIVYRFPPMLLVIAGSLYGLTRFLGIDRQVQQGVQEFLRYSFKRVEEDIRTRYNVLIVVVLAALLSAGALFIGLPALATGFNGSGVGLMNQARQLDMQDAIAEAQASRGQALGMFGWATRLDPNKAEFFYNRASARRQLEGCEKAESDYQKTLELDRTFEAAYNDLGYCYLKTGRYRDAEAVLGKGLDVLASNQDIEPFYRDLTGYKLRRNLANACIHLGRYPAAIALLKAAVEIERLYEGDPKWLMTFRPAETHCLLALVYDRNGYSCDMVREELDKCRKTVAIQEDIDILENTKVTLERCPWGAD